MTDAFLARNTYIWAIDKEYNVYLLSAFFHIKKIPISEILNYCSEIYFIKSCQYILKKPEIFKYIINQKNM
ncbi:hypothetical protein HZS_6419 [Henneguya salminicola]|nr:hypothetical protein HZS_6419 [Henneguya salminicola]